MNKSQDRINEFYKVFCAENLSFAELVRIHCFKNETLLQMPCKDYQSFVKQYNQLASHDKKQFKNTKEKGNALESLVNTIFTYGDNPLLVISKNCHTSTNELDLLLDWTEYARLSSINQLYPELQNPFICECKYYATNVSVTYIGKFYSLLKASDTKIGLFFTWQGVTGRSEWQDAKGLIKKIALKDDIFILVFTQNDYKLLSENKKNIFSIIHDKYLCLKNDIDYCEYISSHENESKLLK